MFCRLPTAAPVEGLTEGVDEVLLDEDWVGGVITGG